MRLLFFYSLRNMTARKMTVFLTAGGMALVVFVFAAVIMMAEGLEKTLVETGSADNVVVFRRSSDTEVQSSVDRAQAVVVETSPDIALDREGRQLLAKELVVLITLPKKGTGNASNVVIRGISDASLKLRPQVDLGVGRLPRPGSTEIVVGRHVAHNFQGTGLGQEIGFAGRNWEIVGILDAGNTGFSSEIWGDVNQLMQAFRRQAYSSIIFTLSDPGLFPTLRERIESDPRLTLEALREREYYRKQSEMLATFLRILGISLTVIFSLGAVVGAMITMYAAVANRTGEIGTLRALGFQRRSILMTFLLESVLLGTIGGVVGLMLASLLQLLSVSTTNFQTFAELAFTFSLSRGIVLQAMGFAVIMGIVGGLPPAIRAARMGIVSALREI